MTKGSASRAQLVRVWSRIAEAHYIMMLGQSGPVAVLCSISCSAIIQGLSRGLDISGLFTGSVAGRVYVIDLRIRSERHKITL
jgi:hypothetical protein